MNILSSEQIRFLDAYTIQNEPISSIDLMERAALTCVEWIEKHFDRGKRICVFCGPGNNGGDGLAITRLLAQRGWQIQAIILNSKGSLSKDCIINLDRLKELFPDLIQEFTEKSALPATIECDLLIDAIFGTGFRGTATGLEAQVIDHINGSNKEIISIDIPSGLTSNEYIKSNDIHIIKSKHTITFQFLKPAMVMPESAPYCGAVHVMDIGLDLKGLHQLSIELQLIDIQYLKGILLDRESSGHKGSFGHAFLMAGGAGKAGAGILALKSCLRSGCGLVTAAVPREENPIYQVACPEAMTTTYSESSTHVQIPLKVNSIGIGPGIGTSSITLETIISILKRWNKPVILDADALNLVGLHPELKSLVPAGSLLTPHVGEFERLFGSSTNDFERLELQKSISKKHQWFILLKGAFTKITTPDGFAYVNPTGNAGMAKGGSGDVLTGLITGLHARGYEIKDAAILGAFLHGLAGDIAAHGLGTEAMNASDLVESIPKAWKQLLDQVANTD